MPIKIYPVNEQFAAEIGDVDLSKPLSDEDQPHIMNVSTVVTDIPAHFR